MMAEPPGRHLTLLPETMRFHEVTHLFPPMSAAEFAELVADIAKQGLLVPIWTHEGQVIDGRHRALACQHLGLSLRAQAWQGSGSLVAFVVSLNLKRRHLTSSQKAMIALDVEEQLAQEAAARQRAQGVHGSEGGRGHRRDLTLLPAPTSPRSYPLPASAGSSAETLGSFATQGFRRSAPEAGRLLGVGATAVKLAKRIVRQAPELKEVVAAGTLALSDARALAPLPQDQRVAIVAQVATGAVKSARAAILASRKAAAVAQAQAMPDKPPLVLARWEQWLPAQPLCDLLLTDPPYATEIADIATFARTWLSPALAKVKASGRAYICVGASPQELRAYLSVPVPAHLHLAQILVWTYKNTLGPQPRRTYQQNWQAILSFVGTQARDLDCPLLLEQTAVQEINAPDGRQGTRFHTWQKPDALADRFIRHSTRPGDLVLDPFAGTGTFLLAAHRLGRMALGCESSEAMLQIAEQRGCRRA